MGDVLVALLAGLVPLLGVAIGARMSRSAANEALDTRLREERRQVIHKMLADLVADVRQKLDLSQLMIPAMAKMTFKDMSEYVETDSGREAGERERRINRALVELGFFVGDTELRQALLGLEGCLRDWAEKAVGPVTQASVRGKGDIDAILKGFDHVNATKQALNKVQQEAITLLPVELRLQPAPSWPARIKQRLARGRK